MRRFNTAAFLFMVFALVLFAGAASISAGVTSTDVIAVDNLNVLPGLDRAAVVTANISPDGYARSGAPAVNATKDNFYSTTDTQDDALRGFPGFGAQEVHQSGGTVRALGMDLERTWRTDRRTQYVGDYIVTNRRFT